MECNWIVEGEKKVSSKVVASEFRQRLLDAHDQLKEDHDNKVVTASSRLEKPTDEDSLITPVTANLDKEYYEETLKGYVEAERVESTRKDGKLRMLGQIGGVIAGGILTLFGMAFLDSCEKREDDPTQPSRHPGFKLLKRF